jgi:hypothetical protein
VTLFRALKSMIWGSTASRAAWDTVILCFAPALQCHIPRDIVHWPSVFIDSQLPVIWKAVVDLSLDNSSRGACSLEFGVLFECFHYPCIDLGVYGNVLLNVLTKFMILFPAVSFFALLVRVSMAGDRYFMINDQVAPRMTKKRHIESLLRNVRGRVSSHSGLLSQYPFLYSTLGNCRELSFSAQYPFSGNALDICLELIFRPVSLLK